MTSPEPIPEETPDLPPEPPPPPAPPAPDELHEYQNVIPSEAEESPPGRQ